MKALLTLCAAFLLLVLPAMATGAAGTASPPGSITVNPGQSGTNGAVSATNNSPLALAPKPKAIISPASNDPTGTDTVSTTNHFQGTISGVGVGDKVFLGNNNQVTVTTTGGEVSVGGMSNGNTTITNTGGAPTKIILPSGSFFWLSGGTVTI